MTTGLIGSIIVWNRNAKPHHIARKHPGATVIDVTSRGPQPWVRFSPFYPHAKIPIPLWPGKTAESVEGIWQALKRFELENHVCEATFANRTMAGLKRHANARRGNVLGHQAGSEESRLLDYRTARQVIYLPAYRYVLENRLTREVAELRAICQNSTVVLLDYSTNEDVYDLSKPLSHAGLVKQWLTQTYQS